jgi:hypothetical protein
MQEAYAICQEVLAESPNDDAVIHPLRLTLVRLGRGTRPSAALSPPTGGECSDSMRSLMVDGHCAVRTRL